MEKTALATAVQESVITNEFSIVVPDDRVKRSINKGEIN